MLFLTSSCCLCWLLAGCGALHLASPTGCLQWWDEHLAEQNPPFPLYTLLAQGHATLGPCYTQAMLHLPPHEDALIKGIPSLNLL